MPPISGFSSLVFQNGNPNTTAIGVENRVAAERVRLFDDAAVYRKAIIAGCGIQKLGALEGVDVGRVAVKDGIAAVVDVAGNEN